MDDTGEVQHRLSPDKNIGLKRLIANFQGRVQGVGFRYTVLTIALNHTVSGWIRNEWDGSVQMEIEGRQAEIEAFIRDIYRSRLGSCIRHLSQQWSEPWGTESGFRIKH